jgi:hypothetical protein
MDRIVQGVNFYTPPNWIVNIKRRRKRSIILPSDIPTRPVRKNRHQHVYLPLNMPPLLPSRTALSALRHGGRSIPASTQRLYWKSFVSGTRSKGSQGKQMKQHNAVRRSPSIYSAVSGSDRDCSAAAKGSVMSDNPGSVQAEYDSPVLDGMESAYSIDLGRQERGPQASFARTAHGDRSLNATTSSMPGVHDSHRDSIGSPLPDPDQLPPPSTDGLLKPPQPSIAISSVGSDGSRETHLFKLGGDSVFAGLFKMGRRKSQSSMYVK